MHRGVRHEQSRKGGGIALSAVTFMIWTGVTASAEDAPTVADDAVAAIDDAVGQLLDTAVSVSVADSTVSVGGGVSVDLSSDASDGIWIDSLTAGDLEIGLPFADTAGDAQVVDGVMVYDNGNGSSTTPLVHADGSVQILTTIADASAPTAYEYQLDLAPGAALVTTGQGGLDIVEANGSVSRTIAAPWAIDANGKAVPTHYLVVGDTLTQVIDFNTSTDFPVVADPTVRAGWWGILPVYRITFTKAETADAKSKTGSAFATASAAFCGLIPGTTVKIACAFFYTLIRVDLNQNATDAVTQNKCLAVRLPATAGAINLPAYDASVTSC